MPVKRLGDYLIEQKICTEMAVNQALKKQAALKKEGFKVSVAWQRAQKGGS